MFTLKFDEAELNLEVALLASSLFPALIKIYSSALDYSLIMEHLFSICEAVNSISNSQRKIKYMCISVV